MTVTRRRARKGDGELLRDEILSATEQLLIETGSEEAVSIRAVARATGVTAPSIYRHFEDKSHLIFEVCARHFGRLDDVLEEAVGGIEDPVQALRARGRAYIRFAVDNPEHYRIMFMAPPYATPEQWADLLGTGSFANLLRAIDETIEAGGIVAVDDVLSTALHVWATIHGLASLLVAKPTMPWPDLDRLIDDHVDLCLRALAPPGSDPEGSRQ